jgi:ferritin-like protein
MSDYHEPASEMSNQARDYTRALNSLKEEIEAVDWYNQRADVTENPELKEILIHNRDEEMEHACMTLEWLRRNMPGWDEMMKTYLFTDGDITELEEHETSGGIKEDSDGNGTADLGIGKIDK